MFVRIRFLSSTFKHQSVKNHRRNNDLINRSEKKYINKIFASFFLFYVKKETTFIHLLFHYPFSNPFSLTFNRSPYENARSTGAIIYLVEVHVSSRLSRNIPSVSLLHCPRTHTVYTDVHRHVGENVCTCRFLTSPYNFPSLFISK